MKRKNRQSRAFFLFGQCKSIHEVAEELEITYKEAQRLKNLYLSVSAIDESSKEGATEFYLQALEKKQLVNGVLAKVRCQLERREVWSRIELMRSWIPEAAEMLLFFSGIEIPLAWSLDGPSFILDRIKKICCN